MDFKVIITRDSETDGHSEEETYYFETYEEAVDYYNDISSSPTDLDEGDMYCRRIELLDENDDECASWCCDWNG